MPEGFCEQCNGKCCTEFTVYVTHADVKRLFDGTGWDPETYVTAYADDQRATYPLLKIGTFDVRLGLTYREKRCLLLNVEDDERRRCTVQQFKPMVCRTYPFSIDDKGKLVHVEPYKCPGPIWPENKADQDQAVREVKKLHGEYQEYESIAKEWNSRLDEQRPDLKTFLEFAFSRMKGSSQ